MDKANRPDYENRAYGRMAEDWKIVQTIYSGTRAVRDAKLLTRFEREQDDDYNNRVNDSEFFNVFQSTLDSCVGMVFQNNVKPDEIPGNVDEIFDDIDLAGNDLDMFLRQTFLNGGRDGHSYIFVDAPPATERRTLADGFRPYWINYTADQVVNWRFVVEAGRVFLEQCTIKECRIEPEGEYGEKEFEYYKVFRRNPGSTVTFEVFRKEGDKTAVEFIPVEEGTMATTEISLVPFYASKVRPYESAPPFLDLADTNLKHYNAQSRLRKALQYVIPVPVFKIDQKNDAKDFQDLTMASDQGVIMWGEHAEAFYLELKGDSVPALERDIDKVEERMARLGLEKFAPSDDAGAKTAYEIGSDNRREFSELAIMAKNLQNCVESCFDFTMEYYGQKADSSLILNIDYDRLTYSIDQLKFFANEVKEGRLSLKTYLKHLPNMFPMPDDFDPEEEERLIQEESRNAFMPLAANGQPVQPQGPEDFIEL